MSKNSRFAAEVNSCSIIWTCIMIPSMKLSKILKRLVWSTLMFQTNIVLWISKTSKVMDQLLWALQQRFWLVSSDTMDNSTLLTSALIYLNLMNNKSSLSMLNKTQKTNCFPYIIKESHFLLEMTCWSRFKLSILKRFILKNWICQKTSWPIFRDNIKWLGTKLVHGNFRMNRSMKDTTNYSLLRKTPSWKHRMSCHTI